MCLCGHTRENDDDDVETTRNNNKPPSLIAVALGLPFALLRHSQDLRNRWPKITHKLALGEVILHYWFHLHFGRYSKVLI